MSVSAERLWLLGEHVCILATLGWQTRRCVYPPLPGTSGRPRPCSGGSPGAWSSGGAAAQTSRCPRTHTARTGTSPGRSFYFLI